MQAHKKSTHLMVTGLVGVLVLVATAPGALGQGAPGRNPRAVEEAITRLKAEAPQAIVYQEGSGITRVAGQPLTFGATPEDSARAFVRAYAGAFGVESEELVPGNTFDGAYARPLMMDPGTGTYKFTLIYYTQYRDDLPVFRAELRVLVRNEAGYPVVWAGSSLRDVGTFRVPAGAARNTAEDLAHAAATHLVPGLVNFGPSDVVVWAGLSGREANPMVAMVFVADNGRPATGEYEKWLFVADVAMGEIIYRESRIMHTDVVGHVQGMATDGHPAKSDACNPENPTALPWAKVGIGSTVAYADANGDFTVPNGGSTPVTVTSYMSGRYFVVYDEGGPIENLSLTVTPPGPANFTHNGANSSEFIRAEVNGYVQANVVRDWTLFYVPDYPTISTQTGFPAYVNINDCCNAYYDGGSINFYRACGGCANTAYSNVVHHEYGHHLIECAGSGQEEYGEGMSDSVGMLIADDPVCGYGFEGDCNVGIRTADNDLQYPCSGEIHYCGQLLSGCIWSTRNELILTDPKYLDTLSNLTVNSILLHTGSQITPQITIDFLTLDDNDGNLGNGTPHWPEICAGFGAHNMGCPDLDIGLSVSPKTGFACSGQVGGPFTPDSIMYMLENLYDTPIDYTVSNTAPWVSLSNTGGTLDGHATTTVTVSINASANGLPLGIYTDVVTFTNTTDHQGDTTRTVTLSVGGLIGYWPFDECSGNVAHDVSGHAHDGTIYSATWTSGVSGGALYFDGVDDYIDVPNTADLRFANQSVTFAAWVTIVDNPNLYRTFVMLGDSDYYPFIRLAKWRSGVEEGRMFFETSQSGTACEVNSLQTGADLPKNQWLHAVGVVDWGAGTITLYLNGDPQESRAACAYDLTQAGTLRLRIGCATANDDFHKGLLDEVRIYSRALSADEVCQLYSDSAPPTLIGDMNCDESVTLADINPFVLYLSDFATWQVTYRCPARNGDINTDGTYGEGSFGDINPFIELLLGR